MPKVIRMNLSTASIDHAIWELNNTKKELNGLLELLIKRLVEEGVQIAKVQITALGAVYTGELLESIEGYYDGESHVGIIRANTPYAVYVEYGTGIVGAGSPHPDPDGWVYDINGHGELGWWYMNDNDAKLHWTQGMRSRPFMYNTKEQLQDLCGKIAKEVFGA